MKIFWDTNLFIYLWEKKSFQPEIQKLLEWMEYHSHTIVTSSLSVGEILVQPLKYGRTDIHDQYLRAFHQITVIPFDTKGASLFALLRSKYPSLKSPDAIQLSCADISRCDLFLTNDTRLSSIKTPHLEKVLSLSDWTKKL